MKNKILGLAAAALLGGVIASGPAAGFEFPWASNRPASKPVQVASSDSHQLAPPGTPEPGERAVGLPSWAPVVKRVMPTVVTISVAQKVNVGMGETPGADSGQNGFNGPFGANPFSGNPFQFFFGPGPHQYTEHGLGSGVLVSPDGYILTNNHVVKNADQIQVTLKDGRAFSAKTVGTDPKTDIALVKINAGTPLPYATLGDSNQTQVGDWVLAIGNPFGFDLTVTSGIVSAKGRSLGGNYDSFIQTDASINPGNSGGPLFNTEGQVIGINSAIYSSTGSNAGVGFAIPIDLAKSVMTQLRAHGHVIRGWLGVEVQNLTPALASSFGLSQPGGALVANVEKHTPAAQAGIERGDIIVGFNGRPVPDEHALPEMVAETQIGQRVPITVVRDGKRLTLYAKVGELPSQELASAEEQGKRAKWGLAVQDLSPDLAQQLGVNPGSGAVISRVVPGTPADDAGLQPGDVILQVDHQTVNSAQDFTQIAREAQHKDQPALLLVERGNQTMYTVITPKG